MSYNGTVRCGHCGVKGHNKTGCDALRKEWVNDPESYYGKQWAQIQARKTSPKTCGYCSEVGHTRAGCSVLKEHKPVYARDLLLWRLALEKHFSSIGYGPLAMIRFKSRPSYVAKISGQTQWVYSSDEHYPGPPVGMTPAKMTDIDVLPGYDHMNTMFLPAIRHQQYPAMGHINMFGPGVIKTRSSSTLQLPVIPGLFPRLGKDHYGNLVDRVELRNEYSDSDLSDWEVVSPSPKKDGKPFGDIFTSDYKIEQMTKARFARGSDVESHDFRAFKSEYRNILNTYLDGILEISDMENVTVDTAFEPI